jgi:hypothetical protein
MGQFLFRPLCGFVGLNMSLAWRQTRKIESNTSHDNKVRLVQERLFVKLSLNPLASLRIGVLINNFSRASPICLLALPCLGCPCCATAELDPKKLANPWITKPCNDAPTHSMPAMRLEIKTLIGQLLPQSPLYTPTGFTITRVSKVCGIGGDGHVANTLIDNPVARMVVLK